MSSLWYVNKAGRIRGPFPTGALVQDRLLGRLADSDLVSADQTQWQPFTSWPELVSAALAASPPPASAEAAAWAGERAKARMRWADERSGEERRAEPAGENQARTQGRRAGPDRRIEGEQSPPRGRGPRNATALFGAEVPVWVLIGMVVLLAAVLGLLAYLFGPVNPVPVKLR